MRLRGSTTDAPSWAEVRGRHRMLRRRRADRSLVAIAGSVYETLITVAIVGGLLVSLGGSVVDALTVPAATPVGAWVCVAGAVAGASTGFRVLLGVGPLNVSPAAAAWLMAGPVDRRQFLLGRYLAVIAVGALLGGAVAMLMAIAGGAAGATVLVTVDGALLGVVLAALAVIAQARPRLGRIVRLTSTGLVTASVLATAALVGAARAALPVSAPQVPGLLPALAAVVLVAVAAGTAVTAWRGLGSLDRHSLTSHAAVVGAVSVGSPWMDTTMVTAVIEERRLQRIATVRSWRRSGGGRSRALLGADLRRIMRSGPALAWWGGLLVLPYLVGVLGPPAGIPLAQLVGVTLAVGRTAAGLRAVAASGGLRLAIGGSDRYLLLAHCVMPLAAGLLWTVLASGAGGSPISLALLPVSAIAVVLRFATRPPRTYTSVLLDTPFGTLPVQAIQEASRGPVLFGVLAGVQLVLG